MSSFDINLHEAVYSLSDALDLVGVTHIHHGKRVAYMAAECGKRMGWHGDRLDNLFQAAILHDSGVSRTRVHARLAQFEWEQEAEHCQIGSDLLGSCTMLASLAPVVLYHHTHWVDLEKLDIPEEIKWNAACIYLVDRVDVLSLAALIDQSNILLGKEAVRQQIIDKRGTWFAPQLVDAFLDISRSEAFWFALESNYVSSYLSAWLSHATERRMSFAELRELMHLFSCIVDAKSSYTKQHSDGVSCLARFLGEQFGLSERSCEMLELAGLLHDLGKLRVPDELLEKPGRLTDEEMTTVKRHSFDTYSILKNIRGLEEVTLWASQHHERVDGSGYPYHVYNGAISLEARIVAVADVFQALAQKRPYRDALQPDQIIAILKDQVACDKLDQRVVAKVEENLQRCWEAALLIAAKA